MLSNRVARRRAKCGGDGVQPIHKKLTGALVRAGRKWN